MVLNTNKIVNGQIDLLTLNDCTSPEIAST